MVILLRRTAIQSVRWSANTYHSIYEYPDPSYLCDGLLGQIGGHLNIFMGMSILAFVEIFEVIVACSILLFNKTFR